jgi:tetratricopeptide (TPR) repeat protein
MMQFTGLPVEIFCAYADKDERFYHELAAHIGPFCSRGLCTLQHVGAIAPGHDIEQTLTSLIERAGVVLVLLSSDYFVSLFSVNAQLQDLLEQKLLQGCLIPVVLRPCAWQASLFGRLNPFPRDGSSISSAAQRDVVWLTLVEELHSRIVPSSAGKGVGNPTLPGGEGTSTRWSIPYQRNPFFTGREELLARLHARLHTESSGSRIQILAMSGLGGIGKTQVALEYAYRYRHNYRAIFWVAAETPEVLLAEFVRLAEPLTLAVYPGQGVSELAALVMDWLNRHRDWLLIFDNVDCLESVRDYLPVGSDGNGQILLTTRAMAAGGLAEILSIEEMQGVEGELLLLRRAGLLAANAPVEETDDEVRGFAAQLVVELGGLPLAIDQAGAYITETGCSLSHYLRLFCECRAQLLVRRGVFPPGHPEPVAATWKLCFQRIEGTVALDLLRLCAFLAPDSIPETILLQGACISDSRLVRLATDPLELDNALATLRGYSLIRRNADYSSVSLHRLVQAVLCDALKPAGRRVWARRAIRALGKALPEPDPVHWREWQCYLPHIFNCVRLIDDYHLVSQEVGELLSQAGAMLRHYARYAEAEKLCERALHMNEQVLGVEHPGTAASLDYLATVLGIQRKYEQAARLYERALQIREQALGPAHPETASTINNLALLYTNWRRYHEAQDLYQRALQIREQALGPEHPDTATTLDNLALLYRQQSHYEQAEPLFKRALQIREHALGLAHPMTASTLNNLAVLYRLCGNYEQAEPLFKRALQIRELSLGPEHPATATALSNLAFLARLQGQHERSLRFYEQALRIREQAFGPEHPNTTITWLNMGELYQEIGANEQAERALQRALLTHEQAFGSEHPRVGSILEVYIKFLQHQGRDEEARPFEQRIQAMRVR